MQAGLGCLAFKGFAALPVCLEFPEKTVYREKGVYLARTAKMESKASRVSKACRDWLGSRGSRVTKVNQAKRDDLDHSAPRVPGETWAKKVLPDCLDYVGLPESRGKEDFQVPWVPEVSRDFQGHPVTWGHQEKTDRQVLQVLQELREPWGSGEREAFLAKEAGLDCQDRRESEEKPDPEERTVPGVSKARKDQRDMLDLLD